MGIFWVTVDILKRWLLTPFNNPQSAEERNYNTRHSQARAVVERSIGLLKGRWRCLDATGGKLCYKPDKVCQIVRACAVLHNLALLKNVPLPPEAACTGHEPDPLPHAHPHPHPGGVQQRLDVMRNLHTQQGLHL
ncbi:putative nuclease HARBI1 [Pseudoliparis swirei]|uniref:putative nuclease HARBI1 n=1 Tax=Pseudoliparis swirei TaxID=2059687 RepID=UPI0024BD6BDB|nr:putative nuclease HARBI1 [Pseudoliparis swirei]